MKKKKSKDYVEFSIRGHKERHEGPWAATFTLTTDDSITINLRKEKKDNSPLILNHTGKKKKKKK